MGAHGQSKSKEDDRHAFRKWPLETESLNPINRALFESWSVALADYDLAALKPHKGKDREGCPQIHDQ